MGILNFFKKAGGWIKDKFHKAKNFVGKFAKPVIKVAKKVVNFVDKTPIAPILSKVSGGLFDTAKKVINLLPDGEVKKNVENFANKAESTAGRVIDKVGNLQDKAKDMIDRGKKISDVIKNAPSSSSKISSLFRPHPKVM
jgi:uncharacterized protein YjbJ (UPF0337 family)